MPKNKARGLKHIAGTPRKMAPTRGETERNQTLLGPAVLKAWPRKPPGSPPTDTYLPLADTCFFNIALPPYSSEAVMRKQLLAAISADWGLDGDEVQGH